MEAPTAVPLHSLLILQEQILRAWNYEWQDELPVRPFPLCRNVQSPVWFVGEMPSSSGERLRAFDPMWPNWAATATDRLFESLRSRFGFEQAYLTDLVKAGPARSRHPEPREIQAFWPFFRREMELLCPRLIVALGDSVQRRLLKLADSSSINQQLSLPSYIVSFGLSNRALLTRIPHPAYATRYNKVQQLEVAFQQLSIMASRIDELLASTLFAAATRSVSRNRGSGNMGQTTEQQEAYHRFFTALLQDWNATTPYAATSVSVRNRSWIALPTGKGGFRYCFAFGQGRRFRVELYIDTGDRGPNKKAFDLLRGQADEIGRLLTQLVVWERITDKRACRISIYRDGCHISDPPEALSELRRWAVQTGIEFRRVMTPRIRQLEL